MANGGMRAARNREARVIVQGPRRIQQGVCLSSQAMSGDSDASPDAELGVMLLRKRPS
jgi:hypothetical protein